MITLTSARGCWGGKKDEEKKRAHNGGKVRQVHAKTKSSILQVSYQLLRVQHILKRILRLWFKLPSSLCTKALPVKNEVFVDNSAELSTGLPDSLHTCPLVVGVSKRSRRRPGPVAFLRKDSKVSPLVYFVKKCLLLGMRLRVL